MKRRVQSTQVASVRMEYDERGWLRAVYPEGAARQALPVFPVCLLPQRCSDQHRYRFHSYRLT